MSRCSKQKRNEIKQPQNAIPANQPTGLCAIERVRIDLLHTIVPNAHTTTLTVQSRRTSSTPSTNRESSKAYLPTLSCLYTSGHQTHLCIMVLFPSSVDALDTISISRCFTNTRMPAACYRAVYVVTDRCSTLLPPRLKIC